MNFRFTYIVLLVLFSFNGKVFCQNDDFGGWNALKAKLNLNKKTYISGEYQLRFNNNYNTFQKSFFAMDMNYKIKKNLDLYGGWRISAFPNDYAPIDQNNKAYSSRITFGTKVNLFKNFLSEKEVDGISFKMRIQNQYEWQKFAPLDIYLRTKLIVDYKLKNTRLNPYLSMEPFFHFNHHVFYLIDEIKSVSMFDEIRYSLGVNWEFEKPIELGLAYIYRSRLDRVENNHILKLSLKYSFSKKKKKPTN